MTFTVTDIYKLAKLINIQLSDEEAQKLMGMLNETIEKINILNELDTSGVEETYQVNGLKNVFLDQTQKQTLSSELALKNAHEVLNNLFVSKAALNR